MRLVFILQVLADAPMDLDADADSEGSDEVEEDEPMPLDGQRSEGGEAVDDATTLVLGAGEDVAPLSDVDSDSDEASSDEAASDPDSPPNEPSGSNGDKGPGDVVAPGCFETPPVRRQLNMDAALSEEKKAEPDQPVREIDSDTTSSSATVACRRTVSFAIVWVGFMANWGVVVYEKWETEGACRGGADATADLLGSLSLRGHENPNHEACNFSNLETMKLPLLGKPQWIKDSEHGMLIRSPPTVGEQVPSLKLFALRMSLVGEVLVKQNIACEVDGADDYDQRPRAKRPKAKAKAKRASFKRRNARAEPSRLHSSPAVQKAQRVCRTFRVTL